MRLCKASAVCTWGVLHSSLTTQRDADSLDRSNASKLKQLIRDSLNELSSAGLLQPGPHTQRPERPSSEQSTPWTHRLQSKAIEAYDSLLTPTQLTFPSRNPGHRMKTFNAAQVLSSGNVVQGLSVVRLHYPFVRERITRRTCDIAPLRTCCCQMDPREAMIVVSIKRLALIYEINAHTFQTLNSRTPRRKKTPSRNTPGPILVAMVAILTRRLTPRLEFKDRTSQILLILLNRSFTVQAVVLRQILFENLCSKRYHQDSRTMTSWPDRHNQEGNSPFLQASPLIGILKEEGTLVLECHFPRRLATLSKLLTPVSATTTQNSLMRYFSIFPLVTSHQLKQVSLPLLSEDVVRRIPARLLDLLSSCLQCCRLSSFVPLWFKTSVLLHGIVI